ncbi:FkbM family methyltransferase [Vibrio ruber]|uniref:FkbM family methyltransferase n=1 Tax=Vibrio ruber TaxID=184755 RepID=UPI0028932DA1|nr:FkbM family methyltransferase [Vibrio ruber]WNJ96498.1 FkbM family methyltransferase [Vibrio ruber]
MYIIDIGANHGEFAVEIAKRNRSFKVIAIEPVEALRDKIKNKANAESIDNLTILDYAIDVEEKVTYLNVAKHNDWGVSSLLDFDQDKLQDEYWKTREDMFFEDKIQVEVRKLSTILEDYNLSENNRIKFIKIDTQGLDLQALISSERYLEFIDAGMLETSVNIGLGLYKDEKYDLYDVLIWLKENGFKIDYIKPNDPASNELNVYFSRESINIHDLEKELSLRGVKIYDGKFYWNLPADKLIDEEDYYRLKNNYKECCSKIERLNSYSQLVNKHINISMPWLNNIEELLMWMSKSRVVRILRIMNRILSR